MAPNKQNGAPAAADNAESPVLAFCAKRLRNLRKRLRNADEIQAKLESGKALNPDQELALSSKPGLLAAIEELEKMASGLKEALKEELVAAAAEARTKALAQAEAAAREKAQQQKGEAEYVAEREAAVAAATEAAKAELEAEKEKAVSAAVAEAVAAVKAEVEAGAAEALEAARAEARAAAAEEAAGTLLDLMYLGNSFDTMTRTPYLAQIAYHERAHAVAYAQHFGVALTDDDLSAVVLASHALSMRLPLGAPISHAEALQHCKELAAKLLQRSSEQQALPPGAPPTTPLTYAELADKLAAIKSLQLFPLVPPYPIPAMVQPASKPASPAPGQAGEEAAPAAAAATAAPAAPAAAAAAAAPRTVSPGASGELPTAEQAAASGQNLVGHFFGGAAAAAPGADGSAPTSEAPAAAAAAPAAEEGGAAGEGATPEDARYPVVHQADPGFTAPPADSVPQPGALSFAGDKSLGISGPLDAAAGGSGAAEASAEGGAAGAPDGMRSGRGGGRGGSAWGGRGDGRGRGRYYSTPGRGRSGDFVPRGGRGGEGYGARGGGGFRGGRGPQEGGYGGGRGDMYRNEGGWGRGGRGGRGRGMQPAAAGTAPPPAAAPAQAALL
ncbi:hypothetical protein CHLNCDRAFT_145248 [Chlorella variabilis]|uniref:Caprin-1 dimerization domain-containing protein n=1 Tax=Chlorella variabilis TaxID=554065 RepID=E1ZE08_CHLVA|nr:hypothetical protein CHLNCDRAFT_145248 [Chlorella variabilis]EFN55948.1 hypothetical protein CHLNCDRAFT_145248 [Chlorella variabilis]|eukprot:XP_005848050.1 hypothetical protein CHLNCDRAFT_145248 [Chlorella variabilis]